MKKVIHEVHRRSLWQVLGIYLAGSWVALQVVEQLAEAAGLPTWVRPLALVLMVIGLPIVLATAFVQEGGTNRDSASRVGIEGGSVEQGSVATDLPTRVPVEPTDGGDAVAVRHRLFTWRNAILGGVFAFALLFGFAGLFVLLRSPESPFGPNVAIAEEADPAIAVLPFSVQGESVAELREGMVELLGTNLDGVGGLRAIDSRTVMARYREHVRGDDAPDFQTALQIARDARARYLLTGSAVAVGTGVRMSSEVYDARNGEKLGGAQVEGSPDDVFGLVDRLSIETLGTILGGGSTDLPRVNLARATTTSLPALRAYLEGSAHFRESEFEDAVRAYERAVQEDSTFALAYYRLSDAAGWAAGIQSEVGQGAIERAARYADRLPEREATLVRATRALIRGDHTAIAPFETFVRRYPDDVEGWYLLGDLYAHLGASGLYDHRKAEEAFARAIQLDPDFSPAHIHFVDHAFFPEADSAAVEARLAAYARLAEGSEPFRQLRLAADVGFGDGARRASAVAALDTASVSLGTMAVANLSHPRLLDAHKEVADAMVRRNHPAARVFGSFDRSARGRPSEMLAFLEDHPLGARSDQEVAFFLHQLSYLVPAEALSRASIDRLARTPIDTTSALELFYAGSYAADLGRTAEADAALGSLRSLERRAREAGDTTAATFMQGAVAGIEGYVAAARGDSARALERLEAARESLVGNYPRMAANDAVRWTRGRILAALRRPADAIPYLASVHPYFTGARLELARAYDQVGDREEARAAYEDFVSAWHNAEAALRPVVDQATERLLQLSDEFGARDEREVILEEGK